MARSSEVPREEPRPQDPFEARSWTECLGFPRIRPSPRKKRLLYSMNDATGSHVQILSLKLRNPNQDSKTRGGTPERGVA